MPNLDIQHKVSFGHSYIEAIKYCLTHSIDMVIKQAKAPDWLDYLFDSDDLHLVRKCPVPTFIIPPLLNSYKRIMVAVDFDHTNSESIELNKDLIQWSAILGQLYKSTVSVLNIYNPAQVEFASMWADNPEALEEETLRQERISRQSMINELVLKSEIQYNPLVKKLDVFIAQGDPKHAIAEHVNRLDIDLLIMGTVGRTGIPGLIIGNTAESTLLQIKSAVFACKPNGFVSPVTLN